MAFSQDFPSVSWLYLRVIQMKKADRPGYLLELYMGRFDYLTHFRGRKEY